MRFTTSLTIIALAFAIALTHVSASTENQEVLPPNPPPTQPDDTSLSSLPSLTTTELRNLALQVWDSRTDSSQSLKEIVRPAVQLIESTISYVAHHPWILLGFIIPALEFWIPLVGFEVGGVVAGSHAAAIQAAIGKIPRGSIFAFLQSYGAGGFARDAMRLAGVWVALAFLIAAVGKMLLDNEVLMEKVVGIVEEVWNSTVTKMGMPTLGGG